MTWHSFWTTNSFSKYIEVYRIDFTSLLTPRWLSLPLRVYSSCYHSKYTTRLQPTSISWDFVVPQNLLRDLYYFRTDLYSRTHSTYRPLTFNVSLIGVNPFSYESLFSFPGLPRGNLSSHVCNSSTPSIFVSDSSLLVSLLLLSSHSSRHYGFMLPIIMIGHTIVPPLKGLPSHEKKRKALLKNRHLTKTQISVPVPGNTCVVLENKRCSIGFYRLVFRTNLYVK